MNRKRKSFAIRDILDLQEPDDGNPGGEGSGSEGGGYHTSLRTADVVLEGRELWAKFHHNGTEMIVTKAGRWGKEDKRREYRRMFPTLQVWVRGLAEGFEFSVFLDFVPLEAQRWRYSFHKSAWVVAGPGDAELPPRVHLHPDSPAPAAHWHRHVLAFDKLKLTNNQLDRNGFCILNSMHRYRPRVSVRVEGVSASGGQRLTRSFTFPNTAFWAVTAYQNHRITELKIASNPFAKGFRETESDDWPPIGIPLLNPHWPDMRFPLL